MKSVKKSRLIKTFAEANQMNPSLRLGSLVRSGLKYLKITPITPLLETTTSAETLGGRRIENSAMFRRKKGNSVKLELVVEYF